ncbi:hypothetical protein SDC9_37051 [bioreactor metagenome]|uniref:Uncharacterized protein n=1 Tax=bioreactor metagenome TaxID=1076179 RepID=A0A644VK00_9ZZZZ
MPDGQGPEASVRAGDLGLDHVAALAGLDRADPGRLDLHRFLCLDAQKLVTVDLDRAEFGGVGHADEREGELAGRLRERQRRDLFGGDLGGDGAGDLGLLAAVGIGALVDGDQLQVGVDQLRHRLAVDCARPVDVDPVARSQEARHAGGDIDLDGEGALVGGEVGHDPGIDARNGDLGAEDRLVRLKGAQCGARPRLALEEGGKLRFGRALPRRQQVEGARGHLVGLDLGNVEIGDGEALAVFQGAPGDHDIGQRRDLRLHRHQHVALLLKLRQLSLEQVDRSAGQRDAESEDENDDEAHFSFPSVRDRDNPAGLGPAGGCRGTGDQCSGTRVV